jgi:hypothetical protein
LALLAIVYFARELVRYWPTIAALSFTPRVATALVGAALVNVLAGMGDGWAWGWLLRGFSVPARSREALGIFLVAQFGKYVPGNVSQHIARVALSRARSWPYRTVVLSLVVENGFALGAGALVAGASLLFGLSGHAGGLARAALTCAAVVGAWLAGAATLRALLERPPRWLARLLALEKPVILRRKLVLGYLGAHVASYAALGVTLVIVVVGLGGVSSGELWRVALAGIAGRFAGYLVPGAPAGIGVREATLTALLAPFYGSTLALSAALLWRLSAVLGDGVLLLVGLAMRARRPA